MLFRQAAANLFKRLRNSAPFPTKNWSSMLNAGELRFSGQRNFGGHTWSSNCRQAFQWVFLPGQTVIILGISSVPALAEDVSVESSSKNATTEAEITGLREIEDGSVISNVHTSKWRVFTDNGRDYFIQGKLEQAERFFLSAIQEAKEGFGERDPHVAAACNNLAELYRVKKAFDKAEPLYVEAIDILEECFGRDDIRVGAALHNLGQFYLVQRKLEKARVCYERSLKIKRRVLGEAHPDYADTIYHLGTVLYLQGKEKDSEDLILDSIRILEDGGQGESILCIRRLQYLAQIYTKANRFTDAEILLRKILHIVELSKGWKSLDTVVAAERLALSLQSVGQLREAAVLLQRCLDARKVLLPEEHIQNAANMLHIARLKVLNSSQLRKMNSSQAMNELDLAKDLLGNSIRIARKVLIRRVKPKENEEFTIVSKKAEKDGHVAMMILLQSLNALGMLEMTKMEIQESREEHQFEADAALRQCISVYKEFGSVKYLSDHPEVKAEYLSCLRHLSNLMSSYMKTNRSSLEEMNEEIQRIEVEISRNRRREH
ncbi:kinesin light chain 3 isoform X2 [Olea europaea var. sylvestris]|uniref:kinesin light chain 3 isoform X2 n=1 Tax=Olea europaea var. sylvestris TaxID=158386 RepID=UPI000C1D228E|nr:kinesin light chain 3 isoform X2 [Olea europaea var. sylvestris]